MLHCCNLFNIIYNNNILAKILNLKSRVLAQIVNDEDTILDNGG